MSKPLSAADIEAAFASATSRTDRCRLGDILHESPALTERVMDVARYDGATISRILKALDRPVSRDVVNRHRKGACRCTGETTR